MIMSEKAEKARSRTAVSETDLRKSEFADSVLAVLEGAEDYRRRMGHSCWGYPRDFGRRKLVSWVLQDGRDGA